MAATRDKDEKAKKKALPKSKLSKPNPKYKQPQYSIEVSPDSVKVIRVDAKGKIVGTGIARYETDPAWADKSWINRLSQHVKDAARDARVPKGANFACTVVASGPNMIVQRFTWPEIHHQAMLTNSTHEIASYLPGTVGNFVVGAEVQKKIEPEEGQAASMDVFVAAISKEMATAISSAVAWAGFRVLSLDVSENVRARLVQRCSRVDGSAPSSYGVLDLSGSHPNITLYLDGHFYSTHYFADTQAAAPSFPTSSADTDIDNMMNSLEGIKGSSSGREDIPTHNVDAILSEITFVVDFIKYQERGSSLECILLMGRVQPGFTERLSTGLDMPVHSMDTWLIGGIFDDVKGDPGLYLDTYASGLPSAVVATQHMLDLKTAVMLKKPMRRLFAIASGLAFVILLALAIGLLIPFLTEQRLRNEYYALDPVEVEVDRIVAAAPTDFQIIVLNEGIEFIETRIDGIYDFYEEFAQAAVVVPILFEAGFSHIFTVEAEEDKVVIVGRTAYFSHLADLMEYFRDHDLFRASVATDVVREMDTLDWETGTAEFEITIFMDRRAGAR